jgi:thymidylate synthase ThyX
MKAEIVADSINESGCRLTTFVLEYPRFIHSELLTHRVFSRNASSSRAIPIEKMIAQVVESPSMPVEWGKNTAGMQAKEVLSEGESEKAKEVWLAARDDIVKHVRQLVRLGVHKQIANRLLEPWQTMRTILSGTDFENFFALRAHSDAQPELRTLAFLMLQRFTTNKPTLIQTGGWHIPFGDQMKSKLKSKSDLSEEDKRQIAVARCARVSYVNFEGKNDCEADKKLYDRLVGASPPHLSPTEHIAKALSSNDKIGNFRGWEQLRYGLSTSLCRCTKA